MTVWIIEKGERYEGADIISAHATKESALAAAKIFRAEDNWTQDDEDELRWDKEDLYYMVIFEQEVLP